MNNVLQDEELARLRHAELQQQAQRYRALKAARAQQDKPAFVRLLGAQVVLIAVIVVLLGALALPLTGTWLGLPSGPAASSGPAIVVDASSLPEGSP